MLVLKKVAITGGISSGKSSVKRFFRELGAYVVSADEIVHQLLSHDTEAGKKIIDLLGPEIVVDDQLDRSRIARKVFTHPKLLKSLENILHPSVYEEIDKQYEQVKKEGNYPLFVAEIALLLETKRKSGFDTVIAVISPSEKCWERFRKETGYERFEFDQRMARQLNPHEKAKRSDIVINNDGTLEDLNEEVKKVFNQLTSEA